MIVVGAEPARGFGAGGGLLARLAALQRSEAALVLNLNLLVLIFLFENYEVKIGLIIIIEVKIEVVVEGKLLLGVSEGSEGHRHCNIESTHCLGFQVYILN